MKFRTLPVKRKPLNNGLFRRLSAVTRNRKQRVAAAAVPGAADMDIDDGGSKISRALTIIFLIHIVAIGLIFIHQKFLDDRPSDTAKLKPAAAEAVASPVPREEGPRFSSSDRIYVVKPGDNYTRIAEAEQVDEGDLRLANEHREIGPGSLLRIPPRRIVAEEPPEVTAIRENTPPDTDRGLVEAVDVTNAPKARLVRPNAVPPISGEIPSASRPAAQGGTATAAPTATSGKTYVVRSGDTIWRISNQLKVSQDALMKANGISDPKKIRAGMSLVIP